MSCMRCNGCARIVDTDFDGDSLYVKDGECWCEFCRDRLDLKPEFEQEIVYGSYV